MAFAGTPCPDPLFYKAMDGRCDEIDGEPLPIPAVHKDGGCITPGHSAKECDEKTNSVILRNMTATYEGFWWFERCTSCRVNPIGTRYNLKYGQASDRNCNYGPCLIKSD